MIALSTVYSISKHTNPFSLIDEIKSLGFSKVELNVEVPEDFILEIAKKLKVVSIHNYCPKLDTIPDGRTIYSPYNISSLDDNERKTAITLTKKTIDVANDIGAGAVVFHTGEVQMELSGRILAKKYNETGGGKEYPEFFNAFLSERKLKLKPFIENVLISLDEILEYASRKNVRLGLENRFWANEIPSLEDYKIIFQKFETDYLGLWYDVGHAYVAEKQRVISSHLDFLKDFSSKIIGMHLHDVIGVYDHKAPGTGEVDFKKISEFVKDTTILVNETHKSATKEQLQNSKTYLKNCGFIKPCLLASQKRGRCN
ncbi:MAG TPA: hypothetical protein DCP53_00775 [Elusimicrobia bacterium]|nr:hypothetical protein [Elusimicrobiota bacterium]